MRLLGQVLADRHVVKFNLIFDYKFDTQTLLTIVCLFVLCRFLFVCLHCLLCV